VQKLKLIVSPTPQYLLCILLLHVSLKNHHIRLFVKIIIISNKGSAYHPHIWLAQDDIISTRNYYISVHHSQSVYAHHHHTHITVWLLMQLNTHTNIICMYERMPSQTEKLSNYAIIGVLTKSTGNLPFEEVF